MYMVWLVLGQSALDDFANNVSKAASKTSDNQIVRVGQGLISVLTSSLQDQNVPILPYIHVLCQ